MSRTPTRRRRGAIAAAVIVALPLSALALAGATLLAPAGQDVPPVRGEDPRATPPGRPAPGGGDVDLAAMLIQGLRSTPGCLGAEAAQWTNGKASIVGWFEDRAAAMRWYEHPMHRRMMDGIDGGEDGDRPMADVPPDVPLMIVATITPSERPEIPGFPGPISQISIELFTPVAGGAMINGRLSPDGFAVQGLDDLSPAGGGGADRAAGDAGIRGDAGGGPGRTGG